MSEGMLCWSTETEKNISLHSVFYNDIALCCVNIPTMLLSLFASGLVVHRYYQTRAQQPVSNTLLFLLAFFNVLQSVVAHSLFISMFIFEFFGIFYCTLQYITETILCVLLGFNFIMATVVLTSERFFAIVYPIYHRVYLRKKMLVYLSLTLFAACAVILPICHQIMTQLSQVLYFYLFLLTFGLVYTVAVYVKIFSISRKSTSFHGEKTESRSSQLQNVSKKEDIDRIHGLFVVETKEETSTKMVLNTVYSNNHMEITAQTETPCQKMRQKTHDVMQTFKLTAKEKKTIFRILRIIGVLCLTSTPSFVAFAYAIAIGTDAVYVNYLLPWGTTIVFTSGVINAYVYCYRNEHFRIRKPTFKNSSGSANGGHSGHGRTQQNS